MLIYANQLSNLLRSYLNEHNLTVKQLADQLQVAPFTVRRWLNKSACPGKARLIKLCHQLNGDTKAFFVISEMSSFISGDNFSLEILHDFLKKTLAINDSVLAMTAVGHIMTRIMALFQKNGIYSTLQIVNTDKSAKSASLVLDIPKSAKLPAVTVDLLFNSDDIKLRASTADGSLSGSYDLTTAAVLVFVKHFRNVYQNLS